MSLRATSRILNIGTKILLKKERGIAINPQRKDLIKATKRSGLPIRKIEEIKEEVDALIGAPLDKPEFTKEVVGVVKWVDGTVIDSIFKLKQ